jgi:alpha-galactosidase
MLRTKGQASAMGIELRPVSKEALALGLYFKDELVSSSVPFEVDVNGRSIDFSGDTSFTQSAPGIKALAQNPDLSVQWGAQQLGSGAVWEFQLETKNIGNRDIILTRADAAAFALAGGPWKVESFASAWGDEFRPQHASTRHDSFLDVRSGRSSHGGTPIVYLIRESDGFTLVVSPAWSGNWHIDIFAGGWLRAGISTWNLELPLSPGESLKAPSVIISAAPNKSLAMSQLQVAIRDNWMARTEKTDKIPLEWNHWWPYEDIEVTEAVILENAELAEPMAIDAIVVDAGWFGESKLDTNWTDLRGDWDRVNLARFPSGLEQLGKQIKAKGMDPGIWMEIEAVGVKSRLRQELPEAIARDDSGSRPDPSYRVGTVSLDIEDPGFLGYVCLGSKVGWNHCYQSIAKVVSTMEARWLKVDFNIDPGAGCRRTDHGHGAGDGLFRHYEGLYRLLDKVREDFPELLIEACSSGGLRIDLGLAKHVHCFFLSDPDYTEHHLQVLYGAAHMLPPLAMLHWPWSWWRNGYEPSQLDWSKVNEETFDLMVRSAMFHRLGVSYPLPKLAPALRERLSHHLRLFKNHIAPLLATATLESLTESPHRGGGGERSPAWQLSSGIGSSEEVHLVLNLALDIDSRRSEFELTQLDSEEEYAVVDLETGDRVEARASDLTPNFLAKHARNARSWILEIRPLKARQ